MQAVECATLSCKAVKQCPAKEQDYMWMTCGLHVNYMWTKCGLHVDDMACIPGY